MQQRGHQAVHRVRGSHRLALSATSHDCAAAVSKIAAAKTVMPNAHELSTLELIRDMPPPHVGSQPDGRIKAQCSPSVAQASLRGGDLLLTTPTALASGGAVASVVGYLNDAHRLPMRRELVSFRPWLRQEEARRLQHLQDSPARVSQGPPSQRQLGLVADRGTR